jgi:hypothetical protein
MIKVYNGYEGVEVELLSYTKDIDNIAIRMCGLTYHHKDDFSNFKNTVDFITKKLIENKTSPKIMEAAHCTFVFKNISRVNLARLTRDQVGAINSESGAVPFHNIETGAFTGKYKKEVSVIKPLAVYNNEQLNKKFDEIIKQIDEFQELVTKNELIWAPDMRYLFPQGETISIAMEYNARQLAAACNKRILNAVGDEDNFAMRKAIVILKKQIELDYNNKQLSELSYKIWQNIIKNTIPKIQFIDELLGDQLCKGMKTRGDCQKPVYNKKDCSLFYELIKAYKTDKELLILEGEKEMVKNWLENDQDAKNFYNNLKSISFVIKQQYKSQSDKYITSCKLQDGTWRSENIKDARKFKSITQANNFLKEKYTYGGNFIIEKIEY